MPTPWFFERLGITPTKDLKLIKRAYAVALKLTDQQSEREAFETLRMAYEQARAWAAEPDEDEVEDDEWEEEEADDGDDDETAGAPPAFIDREDFARPAFVPPGPGRDAYDPGPPPDTADTGQAPSGSAPDTYRIVSPAPFAPQHDPERENAAARHTAMRDWLARLLAADESSAEMLLDDALKDPRLGHLDSQSLFEGHIADALYNEPAGQIALFHAASRRFGWTERNSLASGSTMAANWITRVVNQELQWLDQPGAALGAQNTAIRAAAQTETPGKRAAHQFAPVLAGMHERFPDWLALTLPAGRLRAWQQAHAALSPTWLRLARVRNYYLGDRRKMPGRIIVAVFLLFMVQGFARAVINGSLFSPGKPDSTQAQIAAPATTADESAEPVLAYEFTGAVTKDSCESAHEFIHESNWLEIDDPSAIALLSTRVLLCRQLELWPQVDDPLVTCLRDERLAALTAARDEDGKRCATLTNAKK